MLSERGEKIVIRRDYISYGQNRGGAVGEWEGSGGGGAREATPIYRRMSTDFIGYTTVTILVSDII